MVEPNGPWLFLSSFKQCMNMRVPVNMCCTYPSHFRVQTGRRLGCYHTINIHQVKNVYTARLSCEMQMGQIMTGIINLTQQQKRTAKQFNMATTSFKKEMKHYTYVFLGFL